MTTLSIVFIIIYAIGVQVSGIFLFRQRQKLQPTDHYDGGWVVIGALGSWFFLILYYVSWSHSKDLEEKYKDHV